MQLIQSFKNRYNKITYKLYEFDNGVKLLHLINPSSIDIDVAVVIKAGSAFESKENVPKGTAHFLEHMILNPNSTFQTKEDIDRYEQGSRYRPAIYTNAYTSRKNIYLTAHSNKKGINRVLKRLDSEIEFPKEKFKGYMEKEKNVILAERSRKAKKEKDGYLMSLDFLFKDLLPEFTEDVLGEVDDIKSISINDLESYFKKRFISGNTAITVQSGEELPPVVVKRLEKLANRFPKGKTDAFRKITLDNRWRVGTFFEEKASGISISFLYFFEENEKFDYKEYAVENIFRKLIDWLGYDILREQLGLIYDLSTFRVQGTAFQYNIQGFRFVTEKEKAQKMLEELYTLLHTTAFEFLNSQKGKEWFDDILSSFIFPRTVKFDSEIAENSVTPLLEGYEIFNSNTFVKVSKDVTIKDLEDFLKERIIVPPHIWIESDIEEKELRNIVEESPFKKKFE